MVSVAEGSSGSKRSRDPVRTFVFKELSQVFSLNELCNGFSEDKRVYRGDSIEKVALCPRKLATILKKKKSRCSPMNRLVCRVWLMQNAKV